MRSFFVLIGLITLTATAKAAPTIQVLPDRAKPGAAILVRVRGLASNARARAPAGTLGEAALQFHRVNGGWEAIGAVPLDYAPAPLVAKIDLPDGKAERIEKSIQIVEHTFATVPLEVDPIYVDPPPEEQKRAAEDNAAISRAMKDDGPPLWSRRFRWPIAKREITGRFGDHRLFNGTLDSRHYGTDLEAPNGARIGSANAGEVVLARDCFYTGKTVLIRHGSGLFTAFFHLSEIAVEVGQQVTRGQLIGRVGDTGRTTGAHLHYGVRAQDRWVDPVAFMRLPLAAPKPVEGRRVGG